MSNAGTRSAKFLWNYRFPLTALVVLVTIFAARQLATLSVSNSLEIWYPQDDPELINYREFQQNLRQ